MLTKRKCEIYDSVKDKWVLSDFRTIKTGDKFRLFDKNFSEFVPVIYDGSDNFVALNDSKPFNGDENNYIVDVK